MTQIFDVTDQISDAALQAALSALQNSDPIIIPTDTVFGIIADSTSKKALEKVSEIKSRDPQKSFIITFPSLEKVEEKFTLNPSEKKLAEKFWPGALTLILDDQAVRVPSDIFSQTLLQNFPYPLISTSANLSGQKPITNAESAQKIFQDQIPVIWSSSLSSSLPSTIVKIDQTEKSQILRQGAIPESEILKILSGRADRT